MPNGKTKPEESTYRIHKTFVGEKEVHVEGHYTISKRFMDVETESFGVNIIRENGGRKLTLWCDCQGFRRQQFPRIQHKHVKIALDYQERGEPEWAEYRIFGTGAKAKVKFIRASEE